MQLVLSVNAVCNSVFVDFFFQTAGHRIVSSSTVNSSESLGEQLSIYEQATNQSVQTVVTLNLSSITHIMYGSKVLSPLKGIVTAQRYCHCSKVLLTLKGTVTAQRYCHC